MKKNFNQKICSHIFRGDRISRCDCAGRAFGVKVVVVARLVSGTIGIGRAHGPRFVFGKQNNTLMHSYTNINMYLERAAARGARVGRESKPLSLSSERARANDPGRLRRGYRVPTRGQNTSRSARDRSATARVANCTFEYVSSCRGRRQLPTDEGRTAPGQTRSKHEHSNIPHCTSGMVVAVYRDE